MSMVNPSSKSILLVDDDRELAQLMAEFFAQNGIVIECVHNGADGLARARTGKFDLIVLDVMMPGMDGFEVLRRLREESAVPVLMLTARTEPQSRVEGLNAGADDYLPKPFEPLELLARIRAILRRSEPPPGKPVVDVSGVRLDPSSRTVTVLGEPLELTSIEFDILETLMRAAGRVVTRDDLMLKLYQRPSTPFDRSIDVHISHLRKKFDTTPNLIRTVRGSGYQFAVDGHVAQEPF